MENYEKICPIGEGTYGLVLKCRNKNTGQIVAIKKFKEKDDDIQIQKTAIKEVKILKKIKHDNIVQLFDIFKRKGKLYLVFEYVDHTILEDIDKNPNGLSDDPTNGVVRKMIWQILKAVEYLHSHNIIHRDIKPENILVTNSGIIKLCDFGFARTLAGPGAKYTEYVATRWYRSPELLVGDTEYGKPVDIWAIGCILEEMLTSQPLFPGNSDIDQLYRIIKCLGPLPKRQLEAFFKNPLFVGIRIPEVGKLIPLEIKIPRISPYALAFLKSCLIYDTSKRATIEQLLNSPYFHHDHWANNFDIKLKQVMEYEKEQNEKVKKKKIKKLNELNKHNLKSKKDCKKSMENKNTNDINNKNKQKQHIPIQQHQYYIITHEVNENKSSFIPSIFSKKKNMLSYKSFQKSCLTKATKSLINGVIHIK
ncbi:Pkinase-domain-containing protein [Neocallimastix californiae]|uniref:cyclin-dependent kinase n=1 Tax=Neocallimastix californiae TaxID=1754190 RepID=A0A1Y2BYA7_9FUNG|nr:Pkinase-domain-containing protein [Neocallimastix californiae]|eukprot:ORY39762.1 Pkinase-domain-containing protein [Neocallimastix californiae]